MRVDDLFERGVGVGVGAASDVWAAIENGNVGTSARQGCGGVEAGDSGADDDDAARGGHPRTQFHAAMRAPRVRMASLAGVETLARAEKTSILRAAISERRRW